MTSPRADSPSPTRPRAAPRLTALFVGGGVAVVVLGWWPLTDRLDLPKLALLGTVALIAGSVAVLRGSHRAGLLPALLGALTVVAVGLLPDEMGARVEGWAGWLGALTLGWAASQADTAWLGKALGATGGLVAAVAIAQAAGLDLLAGTRPVSGTLGGPGHLGWTLALLLPFCGALGRRWGAVAAALVAAGLVLSGSRTGWAMALVTLPLWGAAQRGGGPLRVGLMLGGLAALGLDAVTARADLGARVADLVAPHGTAAGRVWLWKLYLSDPGGWLSAGGGPEAFVRWFPQVQATWLQAHPGDLGFRSDLRHAHADIVEIGVDFGLVGLAVIGGVLARVLAAGRMRGAPVAAVLAAAVGGLTAPVLFFAPTLAIAAVACGLRLGPQRGTMPFGALPLLLALAVGQAVLARRVVSEIARSDATSARLTGDARLARSRAQTAATIDPRNPRAWIELALARDAAGDPSAACQAWAEAARDLPIDGVRDRCVPGGPTPR